MEPTMLSETAAFVPYLIKSLEARGYRQGIVPEANELGAASDFVLARMDGMSCQIICILDGERDPGKRFTLSRDKLVDIGQGCLKYTGTVNGAKLPVSIQVYEIGNTAVTDDDRGRLNLLRKPMPGGEK